MSHLLEVCDTDHSLVGSKVRLYHKRIHNFKQKGWPRINTALTSVPEVCTGVCTRFASAIEEALKDCPDNSAEETWSHVRDAIYNSAMANFSKREKKNPEWFEAGITELEPAITPKRTALLDFKREPSEKALSALRKARNDTQRIAR